MDTNAQPDCGTDGGCDACDTYANALAAYRDAYRSYCDAHGYTVGNAGADAITHTRGAIFDGYPYAVPAPHDHTITD